MKVFILLACIFGVSYGALVLGGYNPHNVNDPDVATMANFAMGELGAKQNALLKMVRIVKVEEQVVSGMNYRITMILDDGTHQQMCTVVVYDQPWTSTRTLTDDQCHNTQRSGSVVGMPGAPVSGHSDDVHVQKLVTLAVDNINAMSNSMFRLSAAHVEHVTQQVVAGMKYTFDLTVGESTCRNSQSQMGSDLAACPLNADSMMAPETFHVTALWVAWQTPQYQILSVTKGRLSDQKTYKSKDTTLKFKPKHPKNKLPNSDKNLKKVQKTKKPSKYTTMDLFKEFKIQYKKKYATTAEEKYRYRVFEKNMVKARKIQETEGPGSTAKYGATKFADLTEKEFKQYVGSRWDLHANDGMKKAIIPKGPMPASFDWRDHNAVTEVKNQGSCGSCWAFSTTGNIEGQWAIKKGKLISLSEQELVDCDKVDHGCEGGLPSQAYKEIIRLGGLETEKKYKYDAEDEKCKFNKSDVRVTIHGSLSISQNETKMAAWLAQNGPISIGINAFAMQFYMGGISHPWKIFCNPKSLDHGVLIVGYGTKSGKPYWIVKNSWGKDWGEDGYYLVYRGDGVCGLNTMCTSAVV